MRLSYSDLDNSGDVDSSEILEEKNYYPFGMTHSGYNNVVISENNYFDYNGKELDKSLGLNWLDLGARMYDPAIGRFMVIDPMADFVNYQSPYVVADNNPIANIDIYGLGKCGWICRTINKLLYKEERLNANGRLRDKWDGKTGMRYPPKKKKGEVASNDKKEDCNTCNNSDKGASAIGKISFDTQINVDLAKLPKSKIPKIGKLNPRKTGFRFEDEEFDTRLSVPTTISFIDGGMGTDFDYDYPGTRKTINALIKTLTDYPELKLFMYIKAQTDNSFMSQDNRPEAVKHASRMRRAKGRAEAIMKFLKSKGVDNKIEWDIHPTLESKNGNPENVIHRFDLIGN